jgi:hypothetical protein
MALHYDENLILAVVPVLTFGDARLRNVDAYLPTIRSPKSIKNWCKRNTPKEFAETNVIILYD